MRIAKEKNLIPALFLVVASLAGIMVAFDQDFAVAAIVSAPIALVFFWSLTQSLERAILAWLCVYVFADTLKRLVFVLDLSDPFTQYVPLASSLGFLFVVGWRGFFRRFRARRLDLTDRIMMALLALMFLAIMVSGSMSLSAKALMIPFMVGPYFLFFAYREADRTAGWREKFLKLMVMLGLVAAVYGLIQVFVGPTIIDQKWATRCSGFSIEASKVHYAMTTGSVMRPYSLFADHFTFGYFLVASLIALGAGSWPKKRAWRILTALILLVVLGVAMTRTAWISLVLAMGILALIRFAPKLRPALPAILLTGYVVGSFLVGVVYERFFPRQSFSNPYMAKAFTVGTLAPRQHAGEAFARGLRKYALIGDPGEVSGLGHITAKLSGGADGSPLMLFVDAHNFFINMLARVGLPGLLVLLVFIVLVVKRARTLHGKPDWFVAGACGLLLGGVTGSGTILSGFLVAWCAFALSAPVARYAPLVYEAEKTSSVGYNHA